ncbi:MAG: hypothetical protein ACTSW1_07735 [Candidatus Hodarchaeales archaeon]
MKRAAESCRGCNTTICLVPFRDVEECPCTICLIKAICTRKCDERGQYYVAITV